MRTDSEEFVNGAQIDCRLSLLAAFLVLGDHLPQTGLQRRPARLGIPLADTCFDFAQNRDQVHAQLVVVRKGRHIGRTDLAQLFRSAPVRPSHPSHEFDVLPASTFAFQGPSTRIF